MGIWVRIDPMYTQCVIQREIKQENRPNHEPWLSIILPIDNRFFNYRLNTNSALLYPTQRVAEGKLFLSCPSDSPSVLFFFQYNSSETAQQNFVKLCYKEWTVLVNAHIHRKFVLELCPFWTSKLIYYGHCLSSQILWNRSTEFYASRVKPV